jgi:3-methyl-2-oxobutanoate hydroxymethyltransferase
MKLTLPALREMKLARRPIVMITAYDYPGGRIAEEGGADLVLVGDSAANNVLGPPDAPTARVTMEEMLVLTRAVARACRQALVIGDLPFLSYQVSDEEAVRSAGRFVKDAGADVVKLEGAGRSLERVRAIAGAGIPVMGHVGLTPQTATMLGGLRAQGRSWQQAVRLYDDALALQAAGCFAIVLECVPAEVAAAITHRLTIPTIGIGAGPDTDGQVLVFHDLLGISLEARRSPRFVKRYAEAGAVMRDAVGAYAAEVRERRFPAREHVYPIAAEELSAFRAAIESGTPEQNALSDW